MKLWTYHHGSCIIARYVVVYRIRVTNTLPRSSIVYTQDAPSQDNSVDCGPFVCLYAMITCAGHDVRSIRDLKCFAPQFREFGLYYAAQLVVNKLVVETVPPVPASSSSSAIALGTSRDLVSTSSGFTIEKGVLLTRISTHLDELEKRTAKGEKMISCVCYLRGKGCMGGPEEQAAAHCACIAAGRNCTSECFNCKDDEDCLHYKC